MRITSICALLLSGVAASAAAPDLSGAWTARVSGATLRDPLYSRVQLRAEGAKVTGSWNEWKVAGALNGSAIELALLRADGQPAGKLTGKIAGSGANVELSGEGSMEMRGFGEGRRPSAGNAPVTWSLARAAVRNGGPRTIDFQAKEFYSHYSAAIAPVLHIFPGDTVRTSTVDSGGLDSKLVRRSPGGNPEVGPFYVDGALPGDTLVVRFNKIRLNRDSARSGQRINARAITPAWQVAAKYSDGFSSEWVLDHTAGVARLASPSEAMKNFTVPLLPMLGCVGVAPPSAQSYRAVDLGPFGGNMDYNRMNEGSTLMLPVFHPGALLFMGDAHAAMGDGELTGAALETSVDVEFTVDVIPHGGATGPRLVSKDYWMSIGVAGALPDALQLATAQLADWIKAEYAVNDSEVAVILGTVLIYDVGELVDPQISVVARVPISALNKLKKK